MSSGGNGWGRGRWDDWRRKGGGVRGGTGMARLLRAGMGGGGSAHLLVMLVFFGEKEHSLLFVLACFSARGEIVGRIGCAGAGSRGRLQSVSPGSLGCWSAVALLPIGS